jgi:hypothetical protein
MNPSMLAACVLVTATAGVAAPNEMETLIDRLVKVESGGFGYSGTMSGTEFLAVPGSGAVGTVLFTQHDVAPSDAMRELVIAGVKAVPFLIEHLGDTRATRIKPMEAMMWMSYEDEYDFNRRLAHRSRKESWTGFKKPDIPRAYRLTVGDLCFVALGQIVNRSFSAARYQPTGGLVVNSPSRSAALRKRIRAEWKDLTKKEHRERLIRDLTMPDDTSRQIGAYQRIAFYYPETVESLVLKELDRPLYGNAVYEFARKELYQAASTEKRRELFDAFVKENGAAAADGLLLQLFDDLDSLEANEQKRLHPPLKDFNAQPRELLIQLYKQPESIRSTAMPYVKSASTGEQAAFIAALTLDDSPRIDDAIAGIKSRVEKTMTDEDYLIQACKETLEARAKRRSKTSETSQSK